MKKLTIAFWSFDGGMLEFSLVFLGIALPNV